MQVEHFKLKPAWIIGIVGLIVVIGVGVMLLRPKKLTGSYSTDVTVLFATSKDTMKFTRDNQVVEYSDGEKTNTGTYKIDGDQLVLKLGKTDISAKLAKDNQSFKITSASGMTAFAKRLTYKLDD
ncbi:hypothetical protein ACFP3T_13440 [Lactiplantibacillus dongliensis]|uniref:Uncharacterized protein n=1 Tax=Lactiplantibacillus dongliensis TaxID=2559919 RepID=A0ABW1RAJ2_9LACO|nr:hypothetical protein [Lactiplantibacillus dongliensis]